MKPTIILFAGLVLTTILSCSKDHDDPPPPDPEQPGALVKEKELFFASNWPEKSYLHQFTYDGTGKLIKARYTILMRNGIIHPGSYDSLVYQSGKLLEQFRFQYDVLGKRFFLENKLTYEYQDGLPVKNTLSLYDEASKNFLPAYKTIIQYNNGKDVEQKTYNMNNDLISGYTKTYQGSLVTEMININGLNEPIYKNTYQYVRDTLVGMKEFDLGPGGVFEKTNTTYIYNKGKLVKETYTTMAPYEHLLDSSVYRY